MGDLELPRAEDGLAPDRPVTREWGPAEGRPLLFWPSLDPFGSLQLVEVGPQLAGHGFRVVSIAPPGGGETPPPENPDDYLPTRLARVVLDVADRLGSDRFLYMGASWGGSIGVHLAADHADRLDGLVLLDGGHVDLPRSVSRKDLVRWFEGDWTKFVFDSWDDFFAFANNRVGTWRPSLEARYREAMTEQDGKIVPRASATAAGLAAYGIVSEPPSSVYARLTVPTLLLAAGRNDPAAAVERFVAAVPSATARVLDSGHDIVEGAPEEVVSALLDWLR